MPAVFGSGATVDAAGAVVPPSAVEVVPTPPSEPVVPAEPSGVPAPDAGQAVLPGEGSADPTPVTDDAPSEEPPSADEPSDEELPREVRSERHFRRQLIEDNKFYREQLTRQQQTQLQQAQQMAVLMQQLATLTQAPPSPAPSLTEVAPAVPAVPPQPRPESFATNEEFFVALADWRAEVRSEEKVRQALAERDSREQAQRQAWEAQQRQQQVQQRQQAWQAKMMEGRQQFQDFDMALGNPSASLTPTIQPLVVESVLESAHGPAMLHYLGSHPDVTQALNQMSPYSAARLLGEIEALVRSRAVAPSAPPTPAPRPPPSAPVVPATPLSPPLQPVGGSQAPTSPMQFRPGMALGDYTRMREAEEARRRSA